MTEVVEQISGATENSPRPEELCSRGTSVEIAASSTAGARPAHPARCSHHLR